MISRSAWLLGDRRVALVVGRDELDLGAAEAGQPAGVRRAECWRARDAALLTISAASCTAASAERPALAALPDNGKITPILTSAAAAWPAISAAEITAAASRNLLRMSHSVRCLPLLLRAAIVATLAGCDDLSKKNLYQARRLRSEARVHGGRM